MKTPLLPLKNSLQNFTLLWLILITYCTTAQTTSTINAGEHYLTNNFSDFNFSVPNGAVDPSLSGRAMLIKGMNIQKETVDHDYLNNLLNQLFTDKENYPDNRYFKAKANALEQVSLSIRPAGLILVDYKIHQGGFNNDSKSFTNIGNYGQSNPKLVNIASSVVDDDEGGLNIGTYKSNIEAQFAAGATNAYMILNFAEENFGQPTSNDDRFTIILPFVVEGIVEREVGILGHSVEPQIPHTILHAPPGDQSYSEISNNITKCQSMQESITTGTTNEGNLGVKLGVSGTVGLIVELEVEAYVQFNFSSTSGNYQYKSNSIENCISTNTAVSTTPGVKEDIFIGVGYDTDFGVFETVYIDQTEQIAKIRKDMVFAPTPGVPAREFVYTQANILEQITDKMAIFNNTTLEDKVRANALNQANVWQQVIDINNANKASALIPSPYSNTSYSGNAMQTFETTVSNSSSNTISVDHYLSSSFGIDFAVEVGGTGVSGSYKYTTEKTFGTTNSSENSTSNTLKYVLSDDDASDLFNVDIYRDPMYGTPVFKLLPGFADAGRINAALATGTRTSCPYEGGYQIDQPKLTFTGSNIDANSIIVNQPSTNLDDAAIIPLSICNDSDYPRDYTLSLGPNSNFGSAIFTGIPHAFTNIPAHSCFSTNYSVEIQRNSNSSPMIFKNIEFILTPSCSEETDISTSRFSTVTFGDQALPVELISFKGKATESGNELEWKISEEKNFANYTIERSNNGKVFEAIGKIDGVGNINEKLIYSFIDNTKIEDINYYRLSMKDQDGTSKYSNIIIINNLGDKSDLIKIFPNPVGNNLSVSINSYLKSTTGLKIFDTKGTLIYEKKETPDTGKYINDIDTRNWTIGTYFLKISNGEGVIVKKIVKQ